MSKAKGTKFLLAVFGSISKSEIDVKENGTKGGNGGG